MSTTGSRLKKAEDAPRVPVELLRQRPIQAELLADHLHVGRAAPLVTHDHPGRIAGDQVDQAEDEHDVQQQHSCRGGDAPDDVDRHG
jgi:hypothetical protein